MIPGGAKSYIHHTEQHIVDVIKKDHPDWASQDGSCPRCMDFYRKQITGDKPD